MRVISQESNRYLQYFDDNLLSRLKSLYLFLDVLHDCGLGLQDIQEGLTLVSLSHLFGEVEPLIFLLKRLLLILQLPQLLPKLLFAQLLFLLSGVELLHIRLRLGLHASLQLLQQVRTLRVHD